MRETLLQICFADEIVKVSLLQMRYGNETVKSIGSKNLLKMEANGFNQSDYFVPWQAKALCSITVVFLLNSPNHLHRSRRQTLQQFLQCCSARTLRKCGRRRLCVIGVLFREATRSRVEYRYLK